MKKKKLFNVAGPCNAKDHYMLPVINRNPEILKLIEDKQFFVIHAARQTGKTTVLLELVKEINNKGNYYALYVSLETAQYYTEPQECIPVILDKIAYQINISSLPESVKDIEFNSDKPGANSLNYLLTQFCIKADKPVIVFFDEIDCLGSGTLITFLRQLRDGYINRSMTPFPYSVALVGMRNIRDYKINILAGQKTLGSASPFNVITKSLTLTNFNSDEINELFNQHRKRTQQIISEASIKKIFYYTCGQPWLVNAIARECVDEILKLDYTKEITEEITEQAVQNLMLRRDTHIDSLLERLKEERVRGVVEPMILGKRQAYNILSDNVTYCLDLGLVKDNKGELIPANPIYSEIIIRQLSYDSQYKLISFIENKWLTQENNLDMSGLLAGFQQFWRENSKIWQEIYQYKEAAPHLILQAFLQRIINSEGDQRICHRKKTNGFVCRI